MRKIFIMAAIAAGALSASAQAWEYSEEFQTDFLKSTPDVEVEFVDCFDGTGRKKMTPSVAQQCMRQAWLNKGVDHPVIASSYYDKDQLTAKVASGVARARQRQSGSGSRRAGTSYNYQTSDAHLQWLENKREQQRKAARRAAEKKRQEAMARKIADDNRAAAVTAATNARLQAQTDASIQRDHWHATRGAALARQRARSAARPRGPQFAKFKPKSTGAAKASTLRGANKPRRVMYPQRRNTVRPKLQQVKRTITPGERAAMLKKALMVRAELRRQEKARKKLAQYKGFVLDDNAVSTLGKDWSTPMTQPLAPPPLTSIPAKIKAENKRHKLIIEEMIGPTPREIKQQQS